MGAPARDDYHSLHESERNDAIERLADSPDPKAARELIELFADCQWRTTRLRIVRALARKPTERALQFLFRLARETYDLPMAEAAIWALGQTHHRLAGRFLAHYYAHGPEGLRPAVVGALGQVPERSVAPDLLKSLPEAVRGAKWALVKSLVLALGELKAQEALPELQRLAQMPPAASAGAARYIALGALVSIGKIAREPKWVDPLEASFREDPLEYQIFRGVRTQVQFRAQWKLEDYLSKLFESPGFHPALPLELNHFAAIDVREGLKLFREPKYHDRLCVALASLDFAGIAAWYRELFDPAKLSPAEACAVLESASARLDQDLADFLGGFRAVIAAPDAGAVRQKWLEALAMALPRADVEFRTFFASDAYRALDEEGRVQAVNQLVNHGLTVQAAPARLQAVGKLLEGLLSDDPAPALRSRVLRAMGHLGLAGSSAVTLARESLGGADLASGLAYAEARPEKKLLDSLLEVCAKGAGKNSPALLRALSAQEKLPEKDAGLDKFLNESLAEKAAPETRRAALRLLVAHPRKSRVPDVVRGLRAVDPGVQLEAVIAAKACGDPSVADELAPLLLSPRQSIMGRALDALTALPGLRSKRLAIDFLKERPTDADVCDKLIRCLESPDSQSQYFTGVIDGIIKAYPAHPQLDGLSALRDRLATSSKAGAGGGAKRVTGPDIAAIDRDLAKRVDGYVDFDESAKSALRSAELPFLHPEMFDESVDKSGCVVEYCKAIDIVLERDLGRRTFFPKLEHGLAAFQNVIHAAGLNEDPPSGERVLQALGLNSHFTSQTLPVHKMGQMAHAILTGRILHDRARAVDGLRAWGILLLLFARKGGGRDKPLVPVHGASDDKIAQIARQLMALQDARNPAAHRQTLIHFVDLDQIRAEALAVLGAVHKLFTSSSK